MLISFKPEARGHRRKIAWLAAVILLGAESLAAAHYHPALASGYSTPATASADGGLCAVCLFHFHSPTSPAARLGPIALAVVHESASRHAAAQALVSLDSHLFGRAPPARA